MKLKTSGSNAMVRIDENDKFGRLSGLQKGFNLRFPEGNRQGEISPHGADVVYICYDTSQIMAAAAEVYGRDQSDGRENRITVRSGGHCYEGFVSDKLESDKEYLAIIDVGEMKGFDYVGDEPSLLPDDGFHYTNQPPTYRFKLKSGNQNWDTYVALYKASGKTLPSGSCYSVGAGGHISGGGYGVLSRKYGLTIDRLDGVDILVPDVVNGKLIGLKPIHVSRSDPLGTDEANLFAACCGGGGGQFGIIVNYCFVDLIEAPKEVALVDLVFLKLDRPEFEGLLHRYYEWFSTNQGREETWGLSTKLELRHVRTGPISLHIHYVDKDGGVADDAVLREFLNFVVGPLTEKTRECLFQPETIHASSDVSSMGRATIFPHDIDAVVRRMDWLSATQTINGSGATQSGRYKSAYQMGPFKPEQIEALWIHLFDYLTNDAGYDYQTQSLVQIQSYGGRINTPGNTDFDEGEILDSTSSSQRSSFLKWQPQSYWKWAQPAIGAVDAEYYSDVSAEWLRSLYSHAFPEEKSPLQTSGIPVNHDFEGCYINYPDLDMKFLHGNLGGNQMPNPRWFEIYVPDEKIRNRLMAAKKAWDPLNAFRNKMSIPLE